MIMNKEAFVIQMKTKTKNLSLDIIHMRELFFESKIPHVIINQIIKSSTSVGANYRAACLARSKKEFYSKMCIVLEESDETLYWLEIIEDLIEDKNDALKQLKIEYQEICSIVSSARKNTFP